MIALALIVLGFFLASLAFDGLFDWALYYAIACACTRRVPGVVPLVLLILVPWTLVRVLLLIAAWYTYAYDTTRERLLHSTWVRRSAFVRLVKQWADTHFESESRKRVHALDPTKQYVFACEPHNVQCLHLSLCFAAHGDDLPVELGSKTRVLADVSAMLLPVLAEVLALFGVIDCSRSTLVEYLGTGHSVALCPSGIVGKEHALLDATPVIEDGGVRPVYVYMHRTRVGFLSMAARHRAAVVPVLSVDEVDAYSLWAQRWRAWPFVLPVGRWFVFPRHPVRVLVGEPIDTRVYDAQDAASMARLAEAYRDAQARLAPPHIKLVFRYTNDNE